MWQFLREGVLEEQAHAGSKLHSRATGEERERERERGGALASGRDGRRRRGATLALSLSRLCSQCSHRALAPVTRPPTDCRHPSPSRSTLSSSSSLARSPPSSSSARTLDTHPHRTHQHLVPPAHHGFRPPATRPGRRKGRRRPGSRRPPQGHHRPLGPDKLHRQAPALLGLDPLVRLGLEAGQGQVVGGRHRPRRLVRRRRVVLVPQLGHRPALDPRPERQLLPLQAGHQARVGGRRQRAGRQVVRPAPARQVHRPHRPLLALHRPSPLALPSRFPSFLRSDPPAPPRRCSPPSARRSRRPTSRPRPTTRPRPPPRPRPHPSPRPSRTRSRASSSRPARPSSASTSGPARPRRRPRKAPPTPTTSSAASRTSAATSSTASSASPRAAWASPRTTRCRATSSSRATRTRRSACVPSLSRSRSRSRRPASSLLSLTRAPFLPAVRVQERRRVDQVDRLSASARATRGSRRVGERAGERGEAQLAAWAGGGGFAWLSSSSSARSGASARRDGVVAAGICLYHTLRPSLSLAFPSLLSGSSQSQPQVHVYTLSTLRERARQDSSFYLAPTALRSDLARPPSCSRSPRPARSSARYIRFCRPLPIPPPLSRYSRRDAVLSSPPSLPHPASGTTTHVRLSSLYSRREVMRFEAGARCGSEGV